MHEPMSPQREAIVRREMADTTYGGTWHIRENEVAGVDVWEVTHQKTVLATLPDWGGNLAMWIADARDDIPQLLALVTQLRAELTESNAKLEIAEGQTRERDERVTNLEATLERYVGKEPTVAEEMAYLNRCLNTVHDVCDAAEKQATRWEQPLPVPEWVAAVRHAASGGVLVEDDFDERAVPA